MLSKSKQKKLTLQIMSIKRTLVLGDIHGAYKALIQCLERMNYEPETDRLIFLGDLVDSWSQTKEIIDFIIQVPNKISLLGNHDEWALYHYGSMEHYNEMSIQEWMLHGGEATLKSLGEKEKIDPKYVEFFKSMKLYHEEDGKLFVHAGISLLEKNNGEIPKMEEQHPYCLLWDKQFARDMYEYRNSKTIVKAPYDEVFIGHCPVSTFNMYYTTPQNFLNVWLLDTGAGADGRLTIMDIETKEYKQSDLCKKLYPDEKGRNRISYNDETRLRFS